MIEGAKVFCAFTREWLDGDVAVADGLFAGVGSYEGGTRIGARGRYLVPGFIDAHMHIESSKLTVAEFARLVLAHGTTAIVCDPHEIANVLGTDGVHWLLDACEGVPLDVFVMAPSCVPASPFETPRRPFTLGDMESILRRRRTLGVAEMMNFPAVIAGDEHELAKRALADRADGHAPGVVGRDLDAYLAAGISTDHESFTLDEALQKRRRGCFVLIREASNARNLRDLLPLVRDYGPDFTAFCTDDREPDELLREGHINGMARVAVEEGITPEDAILLASTNGARCHGLSDRGAIAPGFRADFMLLPDLVSFAPEAVYKDGREVVRDGVVDDFATPEVPIWVRQSVHPAPLGRSELRVASTGPEDPRHRDRADAADHARARAGADRARRRGRGRPGARPGEDRRGRAPPRHRPGRHRLRARASACSAARSPPPSPTTRTTSSASASPTRTWRSACAGWPRSAAASSRSTSAACGPSWRCPWRA